MTARYVHSVSLAALVFALAGPAAMRLTAGPALAQPTVDKRKIAKDYTTAGVTAQAAGDYDTALAFYAKAYEVVPHPVLIFNMAQAHRLAGRLIPAIEHYQKYLDADPGGPMVATARELITALEAQRAVEESRRARQAEETRIADETRKADEARAAEEARVVEEARVANQARNGEDARIVEARDPPSPGRADGGGMRIAGLATAGVGVAAVGVGIFYFGAQAQRLSDELSDPAVPFDPQQVEDGEAADRNLIIACAAGGALVVGGVVLYVLGRKKGSAAERVTIAPSLAPDRVGLVFTGRLR